MSIIIRDRCAGYWPIITPRDTLYSMYVDCHSAVETSASLDWLISLAQELQDGDKEFAIWENDCRLICVVLPDGYVVRY